MLPKKALCGSQQFVDFVSSQHDNNIDMLYLCFVIVVPCEYAINDNYFLL